LSEMAISMKEKVELIKKVMEDKKAKNIIDINVGLKSSIADYFVICTGNTNKTIQAIADELTEKMELENLKILSISGYRDANWILIDFGDIIVHVFDEDTRDFYRIEELWS